jgi:hypothetical protein
LFSSILPSLETFLQDWLPTVQLVLQADWQLLLHSPQPTEVLFWGTATVLILVIINASVNLLLLLYNKKRQITSV